MNRHSMRPVISLVLASVIATLLMVTPSLGDVIYVSGVGGSLITIDPVSGLQTTVGNTGVEFRDIAFTPDGRLYGVSNPWGPYNDLHLIDRTNASTTLIGTVIADGVLSATRITALVSDANGVLYGAAIAFSKLYAIDTTDASATYIGGERTASGDLEFDSLWRLLQSSEDNKLYEVDPVTAAGTEIGHMGQIDVRGLAFANGVLYGFSSYNNSMFPIDLTTGSAGTVISLGAFKPTGATVWRSAWDVVPEPGSWLVFGLMIGVAIGGRCFTRRRKASPI